MDPPQEYLSHQAGGFVPQQQQQQRPPQRRPKGPQKLGHRTQQQFVPEPYGSTQLFEDTSGYNDVNMMQQQEMPQQPMFPGQNLMNDPMANMAVQYGSQFADTGKEFVEKKLDHFMSVSKLKYYFAVDTAYVVRKLGLIIFPFAHQDWSIKYDKSEPIAPRYEINAPDLYIPSMAIVTFVLVCGLVLGTQDRFTPEQLGMTISSVLVWLCLELLVIIMTMYGIGISSQVRYLDLLALCSYKYVGMILSALAGLLFKSIGYYAVLLWTSSAIAFFLARTLRLVINPEGQTDGVARSSGNKRRLYILLFIALIQPLFMYFLTRHLSEFEPIKKS